ncbi:hypothetical protein [Ligilactobacillus salivarius]|uniref:Uncharacterized protein n=1 Tax=Ligilactobacillus salivarius TaxID=1624 RepID=A0AAW6Q330_9LACO|nr:hypothetical protein [Ligilactobacillus salivarius]MDF4186928.1 hypothetical protein [Ligilactobacillus salivarius]
MEVDSLLESDLLSEIDSLLDSLTELVSLVELLLVRDIDLLCETDVFDCISLSLVLKLSLTLLLPDPELKLTVSLVAKFWLLSNCFVSAKAVFVVNVAPPATAPSTAAPFNAAVKPSELNLSSDFLSFSLLTS